jgi:DNA-binding response OmpR family regulator
VVKPFALAEVAARLHALLRRRPAAATGRLEAGDLVLDPATARATRNGRDLQLTRRELELLALFMRRAGDILSRREMHEEVWGYTFDPGTNVADVFVGYLRRKLEAAGEPRVLHTVRGVGFVLQP